MSFDHVMVTACTWTITLLYIYFCIWELDLRLNNINLHQSLFFIICIDLNHYCHHYWTSELLLNLWECTQGSDITNKWVVYFVITRYQIVWPYFQNLCLYISGSFYKPFLLFQFHLCPLYPDSLFSSTFLYTTIWTKDYTWDFVRLYQ